MSVRSLRSFLLIATLCFCTACTSGILSVYKELDHDIYLTHDTAVEQGAADLIEGVLSRIDRDASHPELIITNPYDNSLFPLDIASPTFSWRDDDADALRWFITVSFEGSPHAIYVVTGRTEWTPHRELWEIIKANSLNRSSRVTIRGVGVDDRTIRTEGSVSFSTSGDPVGAPIIFKEMPLPFAYSQKHPRKSQWRMGDVSSYDRPRVILKGLPMCGFCHSLSRDGSTFGMDIDYNKDKGAYILAPVTKQMILSRDDIISWNDLPALSETIPNMGLFSKVSPRGRYVMTTVNERPLMAIMDDLYFSQLFFPLTGVLAYYAREEKGFYLLPGANDPEYIQTSPAWSPDGKTIAFSRAKVDRGLIDIMGQKRLLPVDPKTSIDELNRQYRMCYDLYRVPFNDGRGGEPVPLQGASGNGRSNYFPRYSPDGRWIVFTQSDTGLVAQSSSLLYIIPAEGGAARKMTCNRELFNSWHSWSPNGKWLVFVSKVNTPYTELFLTHIDDNGTDSPPVLLSRFKTNRRAAVIPEFANMKADAIEGIMLFD